MVLQWHSPVMLAMILVDVVQPWSPWLSMIDAVHLFHQCHIVSVNDLGSLPL